MKLERFTKKITKQYSCKANDYMLKDNSYNHSRLAIDKLGRLEDIEEDLSIDLIKLFKFCNHNTIIYTKNQLGDIQKYDMNYYGFQINLVYKAIILDTNYYFNDYGKTWAFTKEELEKKYERLSSSIERV